MPDLSRNTLHAEYDNLCRRGCQGIAVDRLKFSIMYGNGNVIPVVDEALRGLVGPEIGSDLARGLCGSYSLRVIVSQGEMRVGKTGYGLVLSGIADHLSSNAAILEAAGPARG